MKFLRLLKQILFPLWLTGVMAALTNAAFAQSVQPPMVADILGATGATDKSVAVFTHLLGSFFTSPLSAMGGTTTLIGGLFLIFNGFVFLVGTLWASYGLIGGIVDTAHKGEVLGQRLSAVWLPIRMVTGIAGIAPIFGGFSLAQVFIVSMTALGIGIANLMLAGALNMTNGFKALLPPTASAAAAPGTDIEAAANALFLIHVCDYARKAIDAQTGSIDGYGKTQSPDQSVLASALYGTPADPSSCGGIVMRGIEYRGSSSATSFRTSSVNYEEYKSLSLKIQAAYKAAEPGFDQSIDALAHRWHNQYALYTRSSAAGASPVTKPAYPKEQIQSAASNYQARINQGVEGALAAQRLKSQALAAPAMAQMKADGWFGIGGWYATFSEASAAMADVTRAVSFEISAPNVSDSVTASINSELRAATKSIDAANNANTEVAVAGGTSSGFDPINKSLCKTLGVPVSATGNCSLGQAIVRKAIDGAAVGSGGGGLINPIIMFKNMGDYAMAASEALYAMLAVLEGSGLGAIANSDGAVATVTKGVMAAVTDGASAVLIGALKQVMTLLPLAAGMMMLTGLVMSIYIPLIPFITWMGGLVQYCVIVFQGLVGAPIAALSHLDTEGDGLGRRTEAGYMFALNVTFRPALMLFGFFAASAIMIVLGTFQAELFATAMANAQGNSITGLMSIIGYLVVFFVLNVVLIQGLFNMIFLLPDQILSLIGASGHMADLGKEVEGRVHGLFLTGARITNRGGNPLGGMLKAGGGAARKAGPGAMGGAGAKAAGAAEKAA